MKLILSIFENKKTETMELLLSQQIHRSYIGVIDAVVAKFTIGTAGEKFPRKFVKSPQGDLIKVTEIELPASARWTPTKKEYVPRYKRAATLAEGARVVEASPKEVAAK